MGTLILEESVKITILKPLALNWCYLIKKKQNMRVKLVLKMNPD